MHIFYGLHASYIWYSFMKMNMWLFENLNWDIGYGSLGLVGIDPIHGMRGEHLLSSNVIKFLHDKDFFSITDSRVFLWSLINVPYLEECCCNGHV